MSNPSEAVFSLLERVPVVSLATLDQGAPAVSLAPFILTRAPVRVVLLLSDLAAHTRALRADPRCGVMVAEPVVPDDPMDHHARPRVLFRATARFLTRDEAREAGLEDLWRARFPNVSPMTLPLQDFHFVKLIPEPGSASFVQGFGRAWRLEGEDFERVTHVTGR